MLQDTVEVLKCARKLIATGWTQGHWKRECHDSPNGIAYCLGGAIYEASSRIMLGDFSTGTRNCEAIRVFNHVAFGANNYDDRLIVQFNDGTGRTREQVLAALDMVIGHLEAGRFVERMFPELAAPVIAPSSYFIPSHTATVSDKKIVYAKTFHMEQNIAIEALTLT